MNLYHETEGSIYSKENSNENLNKVITKVKESDEFHEISFKNSENILSDINKLLRNERRKNILFYLYNKDHNENEEKKSATFQEIVVALNEKEGKNVTTSSVFNHLETLASRNLIYKKKIGNKVKYHITQLTTQLVELVEMYEILKISRVLEETGINKNTLINIIEHSK